MVPAICGFYARRLYKALLLPEDERDEDRVSFLGGWSGGAFIAGAVAMLLLPVNLVWLCIPISIFVLLLYFPVASVIESRAKKVLANHRLQRLCLKSSGLD